MNTRKKIIVIGGGAIGLSTAYYLNKSGHEVTVLDNSPKISNCSFGNAGMVVPSHFIPLAAPGVVWQGLKWLFNPESPFSIKPSLDIQLLSWLFHFYKASKAKHVKQTMTLLYQLNKASSELFKELNKELDFDYESKGLVILANSKKGLKHELVNLTLAKSLGQPVDLLTISDVRDLLGQDQLTIEGGVHYKEDGHLNPITYMSNLEKHLNHNGVNFHKSTEILEITSDKSTITGITTSTGNFSADEYVLSAGAWSAKLVKELGVNLHLAPGKGYSFTLNNPQKPIFATNHSCRGQSCYHSFKNTLRFAGTMEVWRI
ncbi:MAG: FAD-dependent oxidoreductase [Chloroflexia bacterium]|nr:FAD-dependent oxidoreductase [Chloroflexia bacterium]